MIKKLYTYLQITHIYSKIRYLKTASDFYSSQNGKLLCIDEIHRYPNWSQEVKNITDSFPDMEELFSGGSSIEITKGTYDLSRRVAMYRMHGFSFREYLEFGVISVKMHLNLLKTKQLL